MNADTKGRMLLIINPRSGIKKNGATFERVREIFIHSGWELDTVFTEYRGHATELAESAGEYSRVVCMGGDGTFNEVMNGVLKLPRQTELGYIPAGSTNDFAAGLGLPRKLSKSAKFASEHFTQPTDVGVFTADSGESRHFSYVASFGLFTQISYATNQKYKNIFGHMAYVFEGIRTIGDLGKFKPFRMRIELEDGTALEQEYIFGAVTNSTSLGGLMKLDKKNVHVSDGRFELLLVRKPKNLTDLTQTVSALIHHHYRSENIIFGHVERIKMISDAPLNWTLDGEFAGEVSTADISVSAGALSLVRPEGVRKKPFVFKKRVV